VVEQQVPTQDIKIYREVQLVLIIRQETVILPKVEPRIAKGVPMVIKIKYSEPKLNQQNGNIVKRVSKGLEQKNS